MKISRKAVYTIELGDEELLTLIHACDTAYRSCLDFAADPLKTTDVANAARLQGEKYRGVKAMLQNARSGS